MSSGLEIAFSAGQETPEMGDTDDPLNLGARQARRLADWYRLGWLALDEVLASMPPEAQPATIQLWPEHFDAGTHVGLVSGERVNLGFSPGDGYEPEPYVYVGPWSTQRRGDPAFWNAPFGAVLRASDVTPSPDQVQATTWGIVTEVAGLKIRPVECHHWSAGQLSNGQTAIGNPLAFIVETEPDVRIYHYGDTCVFDMRLIGELYEPTVGLLGCTVPHELLDRVPGLPERTAHLRQEMVDARLRYRAWTREHGEDHPDIRDWTWPF